MTLAMLNFWANMKDFCPFWMAQLYGSAIFLNEETKTQRVINLNFSRERQHQYVMCSCFVCNMPVEIFPMKNWESFDPVKSVKIFGIFSDSIPEPQNF